MKKWIIATAVVLALSGCSKEQAKTEQAQQSPTAVVILPSGEQVTVEQSRITPAETSYQGEGIRYSRKVESARIVSPFGVSPGEVISRQTPAQIQTGESPAINIDPTGVSVGKGGETKTIGGAGKWGVFDTIWQRLKDWGLFILIGGAVLLLLPVFIPAAGPIISAGFAALRKAVGWAVPFIGSLIEWLRGKATAKAASQIVDGGESFKASLSKEPGLTPEQRETVLKLFSQSHSAAQDASTKNLVSQIKGD